MAPKLPVTASSVAVCAGMSFLIQQVLQHHVLISQVLVVAAQVGHHMCVDCIMVCELSS